MKLTNEQIKAMQEVELVAEIDNLEDRQNRRNLLVSAYGETDYTRAEQAEINHNYGLCAGELRHRGFARFEGQWVSTQ
jgi:hypothetical protein